MSPEDVCPRCHGAGFTEYETQRNGSYFVQISKCCNEYKYAKEVKRRHAPEKPQEEPVVLAFKRPEQTWT